MRRYRIYTHDGYATLKKPIYDLRYYVGPGYGRYKLCRQGYDNLDDAIEASIGYKKITCNQMVIVDFSLKEITRVI